MYIFCMYVITWAQSCISVKIILYADFTWYTGFSPNISTTSSGILYRVVHSTVLLYSIESMFYNGTVKVLFTAVILIISERGQF